MKVSSNRIVILRKKAVHNIFSVSQVIRFLEGGGTYLDKYGSAT